MFCKYLIISCLFLASLIIKIFNVNLLSALLIFILKQFYNLLIKFKKSKLGNICRLKLFTFLKYYVITKLQKQRKKLFRITTLLTTCA